MLTEFFGNLVHDYWGAYGVLECTYSHCNAYLLCELTAHVEDENLWAENVITAFLAMKQAADQAREKGEKMIDPAHRARFQKPYDQWVAIGFKAHPEQYKPPYKQGVLGRVKQSTETNLLRRLRDKRKDVLRFMNDLQVPFDNNQAERDLRMINVQQKVSAVFRCQAGAERYCVVSSYISLVRKQDQSDQSRLY